MTTTSPHLLSYTARKAHFTNPTAQSLLTIMDTKQTNLSIAVDLTSTIDILTLTETIGPYICCLKTHIDIIQDYNQDFINKLQSLAEKHQFLIFEDRKFADIGNTVSLQYSSGPFKIASWAHITNAHIIPGEGIITGLKQVGMPLGRGLLLLAEMSSQGSMAKGEYTDTAYEWAKKHRDFVFGFIGQRRLGSGDDERPDFVYMTPGVQLQSKGDDLGQQYRTPKTVILESGCDVIIVGRGVYGGFQQGEYGKEEVQEEIRKRCQMYRDQGWEAYKQRLSQ